MTSCDLCGADNPRTVLESPQLDGPLVQCRNCGSPIRRMAAIPADIRFGRLEMRTMLPSRVEAANFNIRNLRLEEEHRLGILNARWRLDLIRKFRTSGKLLEVGCARGDFLSVAKESFEVSGVEPNPGLADDAEKVAPIHRDVIETLPWRDFDVITSFHVIEHVDSPKRFVSAMAERIKPGGLLVLETPDIDSLPFRFMKARVAAVYSRALFLLRSSHDDEAALRLRFQGGNDRPDWKICQCRAHPESLVALFEIHATRGGLCRASGNLPHHSSYQSARYHAGIRGPRLTAAKRWVRGEEKYLCTPRRTQTYFMRFLTVGRIASAQI